MKVRDLIKDTVWIPSRDYDSARPLVSVLMPTFRRGHDGSFLKAARSVLAQSLRSIELIIVDDGSTDGTAGQVASLMATDERVSCLRHPDNLGLPAISEYEAFQRARGEYLAFGFDDFIFNPDALSSLVAFPMTSKHSVVHGYVGWFDKGNLHFLGKDAISHERLRFFNFLANASFLVPRAILRDVGLFDPHIAAARVCDWDLWCRIARKYPIYRAPVFVGVEYGTIRDDSLGNTYPLLEESMQEYFGSDRTDSLRPTNFTAFDVWQMPEGSSIVLSTHVLNARQFFRSRSWTHGLEPLPKEDKLPLERPTVGIYGELGTSLARLFDCLPKSQQESLLYVHPDLSDAQVAWYLAGCGAVIMVRNLLGPSSERVRSMCAAIDIPLYYLIDEIPIAFFQNMGEQIASTKDNLISALRGLNGLLCVSASLADFARDNQLHTSVREIASMTESSSDVFTEIKASARPANSVNWPIRLRKLIELRDVHARIEVQRVEAELDEVSKGLATAKSELASRSYRVALSLRKIAQWVRKLPGRIRLP